MKTCRHRPHFKFIMPRRDKFLTAQIEQNAVCKRCGKPIKLSNKKTIDRLSTVICIIATIIIILICTFDEKFIGCVTCTSIKFIGKPVLIALAITLLLTALPISIIAFYFCKWVEKDESDDIIVTRYKRTTDDTKLLHSLQSTSDTTSNEHTCHQQYEYELDKNLASEKLLATSDAEIGNVYRDYANKWYKLVEYYYSLLKEYDVYDECADIQDRKQNMKDYALSSQEEWRLYAEKALDEYEKYLHVLYGSGSALPTDYEKYRLKMYRFRAIQLYELCRDLCIICDSP